MKLLLDTCVWGGALTEIEAAGHDVIWAGNWDADPGDQEILSRAQNEGRVLVTLDKDFGELVVVRGEPHAGIVRLVDIAATQQAKACIQILAKLGVELEGGGIVTVEPGRLRVRLRAVPVDDDSET
jgi:predicted nuclease of predicted toxin-antitoxin system